jgi:hypothetical protein
MRLTAVVSTVTCCVRYTAVAMRCDVFRPSVYCTLGCKCESSARGKYHPLCEERGPPAERRSPSPHARAKPRAPGLTASTLALRTQPPPPRRHAPRVHPTPPPLRHARRRRRPTLGQDMRRVLALGAVYWVVCVVGELLQAAPAAEADVSAEAVSRPGRPAAAAAAGSAAAAAAATAAGAANAVPAAVTAAAVATSAATAAAVGTAAAAAATEVLPPLARPACALPSLPTLCTR